MRLPINQASDILVLLTLLTTAAVIGLPILSGGYFTYLDNPVHLTEISDLSADPSSGWSTRAFCGFPLGSLHSPLLYGLLTVCSRVGFPIEPLYAFLLLISSAVPAVALYFVARRFLPPLGAGILAYILLIQSPSIVGLESAWGGMWTWYIAVACLLLLMDRLTRAGSSLGQMVRIAALSALIGLTHLYAAFAAVLILILHLLFLCLSGRFPCGRTAADLGGALLGALASAAYWFPVLLTREALVLEQTTLSFDKLVWRLLLPTDFILLHLGTHTVRSGLHYTDAIPMLLLIGGGLTWIMFRGILREARLPAVGFSLALVLLVLLVVFPRAESGPFALLSWRHLYLVRVGLSLATIPLIVRISAAIRSSGHQIPRAGIVAIVLVAVAMGLWWGKPLRQVVPNPRVHEIQQVESLWSWLRDNIDPQDGRVYVQDTYTCPPMSDLTHSHILARTTENTGLPQLGSWYGVVPSGTARWTRGEFGALYDFSCDVTESQEGYQELLNRLSLSNVGLVVVSDPDLARRLRDRHSFEFRYQMGRFVVFENRQAPGSWAGPLTTETQVDIVSYRPGRIVLDVTSAIEEAQIGIRESWHPFWHVTDGPQAEIDQSGYGLIRLEKIPAGEHRIVLKWQSPRLPLILTLLGWASILVIVVLAFRRRTAC